MSKGLIMKNFLKSVQQAKARADFWTEWMSDKFSRHPSMSEFDVHVLYAAECSEAMMEAGLLK